MRLATVSPDGRNDAVNKAELRAHLVRELRSAAQRPAEREAASDAICTAIRQHPAWAGAGLVCAFFPLPSEPQIASLWEKGRAPVFCFPRVRGGEVDLIRLDDPAHRRQATWKLDAAHHDAAPTVAAGEVDLFLVPGLAFTSHGSRLGRGGGFYDRLLPRRSPRSTALGVCFALQLVETVPHEPHDQRVDAVITERGLHPQRVYRK
jgi:5-formyltetrahydrofolate cyclo-ligase